MASPARASDAPVPRGRHAPPLAVRLTVQRRRLFEAAARVFARDGYATASAEAISREAGMSKATFYEHFANKEECILALFDESATEVMRAMEAASEAGGDFSSYEDRARAGIRAFLATLAAYPAQTQTVLVEIIGAGPRAAERRDEVLEAFADYLYDDNAEQAARHGAPAFRSREDAFAVIGASIELVSRKLRAGQPQAVAELEDVMTRVLLGVLAQGARDA
jgi:AcrR family transcriptional regulator